MAFQQGAIIRQADGIGPKDRDDRLAPCPFHGGKRVVAFAAAGVDHAVGRGARGQDVAKRGEGIGGDGFQADRGHGGPPALVP